jgi:hypothetical protein
MQVVGERQVPEPQPITAPRPQTLTEAMPTMSPRSISTTATDHPPPPEYVYRADWKAGVMGAFNVLALILALRLLVLVGIGGAIALTLVALREPDLYRLIALGIYCVAVVCPTVWLASQGR